MGLMNVGRTEGSEIIQLFGRGVRLKGYEFSLKRTKFVKRENPDMNVPKYIEIMETLNIFGVRADYMKQFKEYLEDEGLDIENEPEYIELPVIRNKNVNLGQLRTLKIKDGLDFKRQGPKPNLSVLSEDIASNKIIVDWYPKIQVQASSVSSNDNSLKYTGKLTKKHLAFINMDEVYFQIQEYKNLKAWYNLNITKESLSQLLRNPSWYTLYIPEAELEFTDFKNFKKWHEIAIVLLRKYCDYFYKHKKAEWEFPHLQYEELKEDDTNFIKEEKYVFTVHNPEENDSLMNRLNQLKELLESGKLKDIEFKNYSYGNFEPFLFEKHLYNPLIYIRKNSTEIAVSPINLNEGERNFVFDLRKFYEGNTSFFVDKELYLLRNKSKAGIGFFEANNFFPDFILWLIYQGKQYITFIDPKGIRNLRGKNDAKIQLSVNIKEIENRLRIQDSSIVLNSFIISGTSYDAVSHWGSKDELESLNVLFQNDDDAYITKIFTNVLGE
ncbi:hypothetical protein [Aneurinibacillus tyrosinisolvens]|uniref:hypothetical protein n=1 Tax=Aneurinibacillus tyrosinisolvens TaxID=1443435 RepID=UPI000B1FC40E|nr:hypothetical protein [Aneurinibacillus tyrosinisolvens]